MAGGGRRGGAASLVLLLMAFFATASAIRSDLKHAQGLANALGMGGGYAPCCSCACTRMWPPEINKCACEGEWEGVCPSACKICRCDIFHKCWCMDGFTVDYNNCQAHACETLTAPPGAPATIKEEQRGISSIKSN